MLAKYKFKNLTLNIQTKIVPNVFVVNVPIENKKKLKKLITKLSVCIESNRKKPN